MAFEPVHGHTSRDAHGRKRKSPTWQSWSTMNDRCYNPNKNRWKDYGGRGITVTERWRRGTPNAFQNFLADMGERPPGQTLDRERVNEPYNKENCRWADAKLQRANQRRNSAPKSSG